jgi:hypothetical protein
VAPVGSYLTLRDCQASTSDSTDARLRVSNLKQQFKEERIGKGEGKVTEGTQAHTDAQGDVATQHRTAQTEREEQDEIVDDAGDDLVRFDQPLLLDLDLPPLASWIVSLKDQRPTDTEEEFLQPQRRVVRTAGEDDDHFQRHQKQLKGVGVHVHRDV